MKHFLRFGFLTALLAISGWSYAQSTIDFELVGNDWSWSTFENAGESNSFTVVANPDATGINTSATVGKMVVNAAGQAYAGAESKHGEDMVPFIFDANNSTITIMVWKPVISPVGLKFAESNGEAQPEILVSNTLTNQWEEITFDFSGSIGKGITGIIDQIIIFPDFAARDAEHVCYVDNIKFGTITPSINFSKIGFTIESAGGAKTLNIGTAISWTAVSDQTWLTVGTLSGTGDAAITLTAAENTSADPRSATVTITGGDASTQDIIVKQEGKPLVLPSAPTPPARDVNDVVSIFSDAYATTPTTFQNWFGTTMTDVYVGTSDTLKKVNSTCCFGYEFATAKDLSTFTTLHIDIYPTTISSITIGVVANGEHKKDITLTPNQWNPIEITLSDLTTVANLASVAQTGFWNINGEFYMDNLYFYKAGSVSDTEDPTGFTATKGTITSESVELLLNATDNSGAVIYKVSYGAGPTVETVNGVSGTEKPFIVTGLEPGTAYTFSVTVEDAAGNTAANNPIAVAATTTDISAAPVPAIPEARVISVYSDAYTSLTGSNFFPVWGGQTTQVVEVQLGTDNALKYSTFNYAGMELASSLDAGAMDTLHVDIYTEFETNVRITPISTGPVEFPVALTPLTAGSWNSYDIPLASFTGVSSADILQFKLDGGTGKTFYLDNLYLYKEEDATGINKFDHSNIRIYPNPAESSLFIDGLSEKASVKIFDMGGKLLVKKQNVSKGIDVENFTKGVYFIQIMDNNSVITRKFIKE